MKIAILGFGVEGKSAVDWVRKHYPEAEVEVFDQKEVSGVPEGVKLKVVKDFGVVDFTTADMVIRSPGIRPDVVKNTTLTSVTKIFFEKCPAKIIGVTGTKGKGTTCSLIASILNEAGRKVWLIGNIGVAALDVLDEIDAEDIVVYELSNFQLFDMEQSPHIAVIVHLEVDHQDYHKSLDEYMGAKANITKWQMADDVVVYDRTNQFAIDMAEKSKGKLVEFPAEDWSKRDVLERMLDNLVLPGAHNRFNGEAAICAVQEAGVTDEQVIGRGLKAFTGLPHRLKFVGEVGGVKYYDDSISTTVGSVEAAMVAFDAPEILILGGSSKGVDFAGLATAIAESTNVKHVVLIGPEGERIGGFLREAGYEKMSSVKLDYTMTDVLEEVNQFATEGDVVILSPACASFDRYKNYAERGDDFIRAVEAL